MKRLIAFSVTYTIWQQHIKGVLNVFNEPMNWKKIYIIFLPVFGITLNFLLMVSVYYLNMKLHWLYVELLQEILISTICFFKHQVIKLKCSQMKIQELIFGHFVHLIWFASHCIVWRGCAGIFLNNCSVNMNFVSLIFTNNFWTYNYR